MCAATLKVRWSGVVIGLRVIKIEDVMECVIVERVNRFVVRVRIDRGLFNAYINNTGRLLNYIVEGRSGFCVEFDEPKRTSHRLFSIKDGALGAVIDTQLQMKAFEKAVETGFIPWLKGGSILKRNVKLEGSVIDYLLKVDGDLIYLEVKSAVLRKGRYALYPDCPSLRGRRHIRDLIDHVKEGGKGSVLFIAALPNVEAFKPNEAEDPEIYNLLLMGRKVGVDVKAIALYYDPEDSFIYLYNPDMEVEVP